MGGITDWIYISVPVKEIALPLLSLACHFFPFLHQNRNPGSYWRQGCWNRHVFHHSSWPSVARWPAFGHWDACSCPQVFPTWRDRPFFILPLSHWLELGNGGCCCCPSWTIRKPPEDCEAARQTPVPVLVPSDCGAGAYTQSSFTSIEKLG